MDPELARLVADAERLAPAAPLLTWDGGGGVVPADATDPAQAHALALLAAGRLVTAAHRLAAARVLLGARTAAAVQHAQDLAQLAMAELRPARWIVAAAYDRLRLLAGRPQKYGTHAEHRDGTWRLLPCDRTTTDSERAKWDVPPLHELERQAARLPAPGP